VPEKAFSVCIKDSVFIDPACGTAGFLISSYKYILNQNKDKDKNSTLSSDERKRITDNFAGYDISPDMVRLSRVNMYLHKFIKPQISEYDTLSSQDKWNDNYDVILANPPFMTPKGGIIPHNRYRVKAKRAEVLFVDYIAEHLNPNGKAGVVVPEGIVFQTGNAYKDLRKYLVEDNYLYAVILLPAGVFNPYSGVKTSILLMDKTFAKIKNEILFVKINNDGFDLGAQRRETKGSDIPEAVRIIKDYQNGLDIPDNPLVTIASKKDIAEQDYILVGERYKEAVVINSDWPMVELGEIVEILDSLRKPVTKSDRTSGIYPYYGATGILDYVDQFLFDEPLVLVGEDGAKWGADEKTAFMIDGKTWVNNHAHVLRPIRDKVLDKYLTEVLNFMDLSAFITVVTVPKLNQQNLRQIKIPLPLLHIQEEIVKEIEGYQKIIDGARQIVENYKPTIKIDPKWEMVKLGDVCDIGSSKRIFQGEYVDNGIPFFRTKEIVELSNGNDITNELFISIKRYQEIKSKFDVPKKGDILISAVGTIGISWVVKDNREFYFKDGNLIWIKSSDVLNPSFLKYMLDIFVRDNKNSLTNGVAYNALTIIKLKEVKIPIPSVDEQQGIIRKIDDEISIIEQSKRLIRIFEQKIKDKIAEVWGEDSK